jgi:hypothetical protein
MLLIGDTHGKVLLYQDLIRDEEESIQLGDFGFAREHLWHSHHIDPVKHKVLPGNHDSTLFKYAPHSLGDFGIYKDYFFVRGADSIDKMYRKFGVDWWPDEELDWKEWNACLDLYEKTKPDIVLSHDCPSVAKKLMFHYDEKSFTNRGLQEMFEIHQPEMWFFGHYHKSVQEVLGKTLFICLDELETYRL